MSFHPFLILKKGLKQQPVGDTGAYGWMLIPTTSEDSGKRATGPLGCVQHWHRKRLQKSKRTLHNSIPQKNAYEKKMKPETWWHLMTKRILIIRQFHHGIICLMFASFGSLLQSLGRSWQKMFVFRIRGISPKASICLQNSYDFAICGNM